MKDFKPVCFRNAGERVCGGPRAVSEAEEAEKGRELSPSLPRQCAAQEGIDTFDFLTSVIFSKTWVMKEQ